MRWVESLPERGSSFDEPIGNTTSNHGCVPNHRTHSVSHAAKPTALQLQQRGFFHGREYFMVRSGRLQWLIQADRADLGPAVTGYLFDADCISQNSKPQAYDYTDADGVRSSALEVIPQKSEFAFTAFGEQIAPAGSTPTAYQKSRRRGGPMPCRCATLRRHGGEQHHPPHDHAQRRKSSWH